MNELDLFAAAIAIADPVERASLLDRECAGNSDLRQRLDLLMGAHARSHHLLDHLGRDANATAAHEPRPQLVGTIIAGRYKLLEQIGDGGMGAVWMAEQKEPVKRLVAVKLIKAGMDSKAVLARFEAERQALALMDHPNIAKVHDAGTDDQGRPYFVMELVKGLPLTEYCDVRKLSVSERLDLFVQICSAVQHAHQKAIIHRDLKPTNVLVTEHDGKPVPKVIDFGLAKALNSSQMLTERTLHTAYGTVVGTPLYMAPEQVGINALDVDTRTDIYALGVILYELLTGSTPLEKARFKEAAWDEVKRLIREEEPPRPSTRLSSSVSLPSLAASRQIEPAQLSRLVRGELDWIVMKALEKDRTRRYETANGLAKDVQRYLKGDAVEACPPTLGYRLRKLYRKNRAAILTTGSFAALLLIATGVSLAFGLLAKQSAKRADESARQAKDSERDAQQRLSELVEARKQQAESDYLMSIQFADAGYRYGNLGSARSLLKTAPPDRRGWEWNYLNSLCRGDHLRSLEGNGRPVWSAEFNHDGTLVITASAEKAVKVWDARTGELSLTVEGDDGEEISGASFSSDGRRIVTDSYHDSLSADKPRAVKLWDARTGKLIKTLQQDTGWVNQAAFSPDSKWIVTTHRENIAKVWDAETGKEKVTLEGHTDQVNHAVFIQKCTRLVTTSYDKTARVWDIETGKEQVQFAEHNQRLFGVACSPADDGRTVATHGVGEGVKVWDSETGKEKFKLGEDSEKLGVPRFSPDGARIVATSRNRSVKVYDARTGEEKLKIQIEIGFPQTIPVFSPDGSKLLLQAGDENTATIHDAKTGAIIKILKGHGRQVQRATFSPDGKYVLTCSMDRTAKIWDASPTPGPLDFLTPESGSEIIRIALSRGDSPRIAVITRNTTTNQRLLAVWDFKSRRKIRDLPIASGIVWGINFSPDGERIVAVINVLTNREPIAYGDGIAEVWDARTGKLLRTLGGHTAYVWTAEFSPDGKWIVTASNDKTAKVWNANAGTVVRELIGHAQYVRSANFSPDGKTILTASADKTVTVWDAETGTARRTFSFDGAQYSARYSPDGKRILTVSTNRQGGWHSKVWDIATESALFTLEPSSMGISADYSPDGTRIITSNSNGPAKLWDAETGRELLTLSNSGGSAWRTSFTPDGHWIVMEDQYGRITVLDGTPLPEPKK